MSPPELVALFLAPLEATGVQYMVTGSVAATIYGEPRLTQDVDLVLQLSSSDAARVVDAFPDSEYYAPPLEVLTDEAGRPTDGHFNLLHRETGLRADCYLAGDDALCLWGLANCRSLAVGEQRIRVAAPEYVILQKLRYFRAGGGEKHLRDIARMLRVSRDGIDYTVIASWVESLGLVAAWDAARSFHSD